MNQSSRLTFSAAVTLTVHIVFLLKVGIPVASSDANLASTLMQINFISAAQAEPFPAKHLLVEASLKPTTMPSPDMKKNKKQETKKETKKTNQANLPRTNANANTKPNRPIQPSKTNLTSVVRDNNALFLQAPRFKSLPPAPNYPRQARLRRQQGTVLIHAQLNIKGDVIKTRIAKSSGFSLLDAAALKAIRGWDFMPGINDTSESQAWVEVPVQFILNPKKVS